MPDRSDRKPGPFRTAGEPLKVTVLDVLLEMRRSDAVTVEVRLVTWGDNPTPRVDIRQRIKTKRYQGGGGKGISLYLEEFTQIASPELAARAQRVADEAARQP